MDYKDPAVLQSCGNTNPNPPIRLLASTPVIQPEGCTPGCIVLREFAGQYAAHNVQTTEDGEPVSYYWGHYFHKSEPDALRNAMAKFVAKAIAWHNLGLTERPQQIPDRDIVGYRYTS